MKKIIIASFVLIALFPGCVDDFDKNDITNPESNLVDENISLKSGLVHSTSFDILTTNQASNKLEIYNDNSSDWNSSSSLLWSWKPSTSNGYSTAEVNAWGLPSGAKLRDNDDNWGGRWIAATSSNGLATIASYPNGYKKWALNVGGNPHDAELLPNGNIAIAASSGGWIRVYASSQGSTNSTYYQFSLADAHSVLWDPGINRLWVLGGDYLKALSVGGTAANPTLSEDTNYSCTLPVVFDVRDGHFLYPYYGDSNLMWVTTGARVYIFNKTLKEFSPSPGSTFLWGVKAVGNQPSGQIILNRPDGLDSWPEPSTLNSWTTRYIQNYSSSGSYLSAWHKSNTAWYKGIVFWPEYRYSTSTANDFPIITTNQAFNKIELYDYYSTNWNSSTDIIWSWQPSTSLNYTTAEVNAWSLPSDAKIRNNSTWGGQWLVATCSGGLATIASYSNKTKKWALNVGGNPLSAELLTNGNIVIANSTLNWVRVYASSQGASNSTYYEYSLTGARSVLWDPSINRLWVIGSSSLKALIVGGTSANPTLSEDSSYNTSLTSAGYFVSAYYGDNNKLWVATDTKVYTFSKSEKSLTKIFDKANVRAVSNQPSGIIVLNRPDSSKSPAPADPSTLNTWTTTYIDYYTTGSKWRTAGHKVGAAYYRGSVCNPDYQ